MTVLSNLVSTASRAYILALSVRFTLLLTFSRSTIGGSITLNTTSPWDFPLIDVAFLTAPIDLLILREAYKSVRTFMAAPAFANYIIGPYGTADASTDEDIDAYIRNFTTSVWHPVGTAAMSAVGSTDGVVTPDLLVKGVNGLRIVDASIMVRSTLVADINNTLTLLHAQPVIPAAHTQAAIYAIAERASDLIKKAWKL